MPQLHFNSCLHCKNDTLFFKKNDDDKEKDVIMNSYVRFKSEYLLPHLEAVLRKGFTVRT